MGLAEGSSIGTLKNALLLSFLDLNSDRLPAFWGCTTKIGLMWVCTISQRCDWEVGRWNGCIYRALIRWITSPFLSLQTEDENNHSQEGFGDMRYDHTVGMFIGPKKDLVVNLQFYSSLFAKVFSCNRLRMIIATLVLWTPNNWMDCLIFFYDDGYLDNMWMEGET